MFISAAVSPDIACHYVLEFLKITFFMGIPFVLIMGFMKKKTVYSIPWILSGILIAAVLGLYINLLANLPQRAERRHIISEGGSLTAEGKYDEAIEEYAKLEKLGQEQEMEKYMARVLKEKQAASDLSQARTLYAEGKKEQALEVLRSIPNDTRAFRDADRLRKELGG